MKKKSLNVKTTDMKNHDLSEKLAVFFIILEFVAVILTVAAVKLGYIVTY